MTGRIGWVDATGGLSGDMLLGACLDAGADLAVVRAAIDRLDLRERVEVTSEPTQRAGIGATRAIVSTAESRHRRTLPDVLALLEGLDPAVRTPAAEVFRHLADAESTVHRVPAEEVHFHEVGALDSIADVVGVVAALGSLGLDRLMCSPIALGGGRARTEHGPIPVPGPAVVELLRAHDAPGFGGPVDFELATPTGVALMVTLADGFGPLPELRPELVGAGAGAAEPEGHANLTRLVVGSPVATGAAAVREMVLEANVDDLDPRLWPGVLTALMEAGASDAWLTPILMKKGRPAHTLSVLARPDLVAELERVVLAHTTTIGLRRHAVDKVALPRETAEVEVYGEQVRVKLARLDGEVVTATPEYDDVARVAALKGLPERVVLDAARAAAGDVER
ncbi:MAG: nickel pincer cofactor biosynthesis protein LarC [Nocardioides sp.]